jgi:hypothetical protein
MVLHTAMVLHVLFIQQKNFPSIEHGTTHRHGFMRSGKGNFFSILNKPTVKKSNPAAEPHGSPHGFIVRPKKGAGQWSMAGGGLFSILR